MNRPDNISPAVALARSKSFSLRDFFDRERNLGIILMLPGAILLIAFMAYPFFLGIWLSLTDSTIGRIGAIYRPPEFY